MTLLYGCDVSTFQAPGLIDWRTKDFGIVRAMYGTRPDGKCIQHVERIRAAGKIVGLYHFFRPDQSIAEQVAKFGEMALACKLGPGDMFPCIDVEDYPDKFSGNTPTHYAPVSPDWREPLLRLVEAFERIYGGAILYITQRDWGRLGKPPWVLQRPLWVAHYPGKGATSPLKAPATPGGVPWRIWQWMVGPLDQRLQDHTSKVAVDQNVASSPLPLISAPEAKPDPEPVAEPYEAERAIPWITLTEEDWDEMRAARDAQIREQTEDQ